MVRGYQNWNRCRVGAGWGKEDICAEGNPSLRRRGGSVQGEAQPWRRDWSPTYLINCPANKNDRSQVSQSENRATNTGRRR